ncbi:hypothetical protein ANTQUA_LOCUS973 [Anthophora quadrimaculata]
MLLVGSAGDNEGLAKSIVLSASVLYFGMETAQSLVVLCRGRTFGSAILAAYCIQCFGEPWFMPDEQCHGFGWREPSKHQARKLRSFRRSSGDGSAGRWRVRTSGTSGR